MILRTRTRRLPYLTTGACALLVFASPPTRAAQFTLINVDANDEGFNDPTERSPEGGNPETTLGAQRVAVVAEAARRWGRSLNSDVVITVEMSFAPLPCSTGAVLGSAGPSGLYRDFAGAPISDTWYPAALAESLAGEELDRDPSDIVAQFNAALDTDSCLPGTSWYYGFDHLPQSDQIDLLAVVLHELGHGLGFAEYVSSTTGAFLGGSPSSFGHLAVDSDEGLAWSELNDRQRLDSMSNTRKIVWAGESTTTRIPHYMVSGTPTLSLSPNVAGFSGVVDAAEFGSALNATGTSAPVARVTPADACEPLPALNGAVALVARGNCTFIDKARNVEAAGGRALLVYNLTHGSPPGAMLGVGEVGIPALRLSYADGMLLSDELAEGTTLDARLYLAAAPLGTRAGQLLLYTPNPIEPGSSIAHWDPTASRIPAADSRSRDLLMEPSISAGLSGFDLTLPMLKDQGWSVLYCGNGQLDPDEQCDDGNLTAGDGCSEDCHSEYCGDGLTNSVAEQCDDGNTQRGDGCYQCRVEACGDGWADPATEECDDGNLNSGDGCDARCERESAVPAEPEPGGPTAEPAPTGLTPSHEPSAPSPVDKPKTSSDELPSQPKLKPSPSLQPDSGNLAPKPQASTNETSPPQSTPAGGESAGGPHVPDAEELNVDESSQREARREPVPQLAETPGEEVGDSTSRVSQVNAHGINDTPSVGCSTTPTRPPNTAWCGLVACALCLWRRRQRPSEA